MELYACGFNAWNQLRFGGNLVEEPYDLWHFERVLKDKIVEIRKVGFSSTLGKPCGENLWYHPILPFIILDLDLLQYPRDKGVRNSKRSGH